MPSIRNIAVFCGSNSGSDDIFRKKTMQLGSQLAKEGVGIVYGGTKKGLMGVLADATLESRGSAHGIITTSLHEKGHSHPRLSRIDFVATVNERKKRMIDGADAFIALPGGIGTLEELMTVWSLNQLGEMDKPFGVFDINGYYQPLVDMIDRMISEGFLPAVHRNAIVVESEAPVLLQSLREFKPVTTPKWL